MKLDTKCSILVYYEYLEYFKALSDKEFGLLIRAMLKYDSMGEIQEFEDDKLQMAFSVAKSQLDINMKKYEKRCEINKQNGKLGGRPIKENRDILN